MRPITNPGRVAGALYLLVAVTGAFSVMYVPRVLIVSGDAAATARNILASETLFRVGIVGELLSAVIFAFLVLSLYRLLNGVDKTQASLMVILALLSVAIAFVIVLNELATLRLLHATGLSVFDSSQREALGSLLLGVHEDGFVVNSIFWGLWLFPFGVLVFRSGFLPRILGILLLVNGVAYVSQSLTSLLLPQYEHAVARATFPALTGELWIMLWLLVRGANGQRVPASAA